MENKKKNFFEIDMCNGPLLGKIILFAIPLILSGVLQLLFNAADIVVVGRYAGSQSLAAVGSTSSLVNLLINLFIGLSIGANVLVARYYGSQNARGIEETVHTSMLTAFAGGCLLIVVGNLFAEPMLSLMGTPEDVINKSVLYMKILFAGMPAMLVFNFGSAILRAVGDTIRPLIFLFVAGIINVLLNVFFVTECHMDVAGVALATVISQVISAVLILICLMVTKGDYRLNLKRLRIVPDKLKGIVRIGLPAGLQSAVFSISNILIQSSINSFGSIAMAGNTASSNIEGFIYNAMNAIYQTALSFTSQNYGAGNYKRMTKVLFICLGFVITVGLVMGNSAVWGGEQLLSIYSPNHEVVAFGMKRLRIIGTTYFVCGLMEVMVGALRGMGYSVVPMLVSLTGACAFRIIWIFTFFAMDRTLENLYISYPVSWLITVLAHVAYYIWLRSQMAKKTQTSRSGGGETT